MQFKTPAPGTSGLSHAAPVPVRGRVPSRVPAPGVASRDSAPASHSTLSTLIAGSPNWHSAARAQVSGATTATGWLVCAVAALSAYVGGAVEPGNWFGRIASYGGNSWIPVTLGILSALTLLATAVNTSGLRSFSAPWLRTFVAGCVAGVLASLGLAAAVALAVVLAIVAVVISVVVLGILLFALLDA